MSKGNIQDIIEGAVINGDWAFKSASGLIAFVISEDDVTGGASGFADGCLYIYAAASGGAAYMNQGTSTSASWVELGAIGSPTPS